MTFPLTGSAYSYREGLMEGSFFQERNSFTVNMIIFLFKHKTSYNDSCIIIIMHVIKNLTLSVQFHNHNSCLVLLLCLVRFAAAIYLSIIVEYATFSDTSISIFVGV